MPRAKYKPSDTPKEARESWAPSSNNGRRKGWARRSTIELAEQMKADRLEKESRGEVERGEGGRTPPNTSRRCPACASDPNIEDLSVHERCYRVICACPCYWDIRIRDAKMGLIYEEEEEEDKQGKREREWEGPTNIHAAGKAVDISTPKRPSRSKAHLRRGLTPNPWE